MPPPGSVTVTLADDFWAPRQALLREHTLPVLLERLEAHGVVDNFRRLAPGGPARPRQGLWFTDSDLYKWMEAAAWAGRTDLLDPVVEAVVGAARPDGYLHTHFDTGPGTPGRYVDLGSSHEWYCGGHLVEAALAHHQATGEADLLDVAVRWADHLCATFGPGRDERVDAHPEAELALARLAGATGTERYLAQARWAVERQLELAGLDLATVDLAGHAVKALYLASGVAEVAAATGEGPWLEAVRRLFDTLVEQRSYPTGAVGGRWLDESVGKPYELPDAMSYAESCAAVAATRFCQRVWDLTGDHRALDHVETLLFNAVPCGTGAEGDTWFYSQPHAVAEVAGESNPWAQPFEYQQQMLLSWFPARRHRWFDVTCCPPNLARLTATVHHHVADLDDDGNLLLHLPVACRITGAGWDVEVGGDYPDGGSVRVSAWAAPAGTQVRVREPGWAGGRLHRALPVGGWLRIPVEPTWWETDPRVEGAAGTVFLRRGPVVHCVEGVDLPGVDLRDLVVDPGRPPADAFGRRVRPDRAEGDRPRLHAPVEGAAPTVEPLPGVPTVPYHAWANRGTTTMRLRFPRFQGLPAVADAPPAAVDPPADPYRRQPERVAPDPYRRVPDRPAPGPPTRRGRR